jgi:hypothetical protein
MVGLDGPPAEASYVSYDAPPGGLVALGDADADGLSDFAVAVTYETRGSSSVQRGSLTAHSGRDGSVLWQVRGSSARDAADGRACHLGEAAPAGDVDGDGVTDVYVLEEWSKASFLVYSGKDGALIGRPATPRKARIRPLRAHDVNGDGVPDLIFRGDRALGLTACLGPDFTETVDLPGPWTDPDQHPVWLMARFPDADADGTEEYLVRRYLGDRMEVAVLSPDGLRTVRSLTGERATITGTDAWCSPGDVDGDGLADAVISSTVGGGADGRSSSLRALSSADGRLLWQTDGTSLPGGPGRFAVDAATGERRDLQPDVGFGAPATVVPDVDGDGVADVVTGAYAEVGGRGRRCVLAFSGAGGGMLGNLTAAVEAFRLPSRLNAHQMVLLEATGPRGEPGLAVYGTNVRTEEHTVCVVPLPRSL